MSDPDATALVVDVAIAGGGLVGASLALALAKLQLKVALLEATPFGSIDQPSFDDRSTAISNGSRRIFEALGVWPLIEREATAIRRIHVSDQGRFGFTRIDAKEQGLSSLGFVVVNRVMGAALWRRLQAEPSITVLAPAKVQSMQLQQHRQRIECEVEGGVRIVEAKLAIAADGARSTLRQSAGIGSSTWDYEQVALVSNVLSQHFHDHVAYERFTNAGPLALLPLTEGRLGVVWTFSPETAKEMTALSDAEFLARLQDTFGFRLGRLTRVGQRQLYPLSLTRSDQYVAERLAIVGNAAQTLHPIAGQGFNLGLRDAVSLAEVLADGLAQVGGGEFDAGDGLWLQRYREWRAADRGNIVRFTDGLVRLFSQPLGPIKLLRNAGMLAFDLMPAAKDALSQLSLGAAGRVPRLARGAPLVDR
jgi:2-octaprenyl-6-methoxyphenol hydroxylase